MPRLSSPCLRIARIGHWPKNIFVILMFVHVPDLYELFNVEPARSVPLWTVGESAAAQRP